MKIENPDPCPKCGKKGMPPWGNLTWRARQCQECGYIEERSGEAAAIPAALPRAEERTP